MEIVPFSGGTAVRQWSLGAIPQGDYVLRFVPLGLEFPVEVVAGIANRVECVVPPVARAVIEARDGDRLLASPLVLTSSKASGGGFAATSDQSTQDQDTYTLVTMPGEVELMIVPPGYPPLRETMVLEAGWNYRKIDFSPKPGIQLRAIDASGSEVEVSWWFQVQASPVSGTGELVDTIVETVGGLGAEKRTSRPTLFFSDEGEYLLEFPETPEGGRPAPLTVTVDGDVPGALYDVVLPGP
jgi:hypothetical protein